MNQSFEMGGMEGSGCDDVLMMKVGTDMPLEETGIQQLNPPFPIPSTPHLETDLALESVLKSSEEDADVGDELQEVNDELESEQVNDENENEDSDKRSSTSPLKDAFGLVDEFTDSVDNIEKSSNEPTFTSSDITGSGVGYPSQNANNPLELVDTGNVPVDIGNVPDKDIPEETLMVQPDVFENFDESSGVVATSLEEQDEASEDPFADEGPEETVDDPFGEEDPLLDKDSDSKLKSKAIKRKNSEDDSAEASVRKSSRLKAKPVPFLMTNNIQETPKKVKMLQRPEERPTQVDEASDCQASSDNEADNKEKETSEPERFDVGQGDPSREAGADADRKIDHELLLPFSFGWKREVIFRPVKTGPPVIDVFYWPPKADSSPTGGSKVKESASGRKRRSKVDQERYFEESPHPRLSVNNFSYVRRALGLNNECYEMIRHSRPGLETRSEKNRRASRKVGSYREVMEHEGLLSTSGSEGEDEAEAGIEEVTEFDLGISVSLQLLDGVTPLREEHVKKRKYPDRARCLTPPLAQDMPWSQLDDDPLGVYTELANSGGRPTTPPPLRALRLTLKCTEEAILERVAEVKAALPSHFDRIKEGNKDLAGQEHLASHDLAVKKWKNWRPPQERQREAREKAEQAWRPPSHSGSSGTGGSTSAMKRVQQNNLRMRAQQGPIIATTTATSPVKAVANNIVKLRLPMTAINGKRPVVELVMLTEGKYQPIKFTNNRQVTESIPKRLFEQANFLKKTLYQRSVQVPKIGTKQVFLAINPSPVQAPGQQVQGGGVVKPPNTPPGGQTAATPTANLTAQVSILVRPAKGGAAVLLNVPRSVAGRVKVGTTLSFSASADQKYTVLDNKMHPPVGQQAKKQIPPTATNTASRIPSLPSGVSIRPVAAGSAASKKSVSAGRPVSYPVRQAPPLQPTRHPKPPPLLRKPAPPPQAAPSPSLHFAPCSPFCPGVTGIPELECQVCHSLFHPKCVGIPPSQVDSLQDSFKCKRCASTGGAQTEVIDLD